MNNIFDISVSAFKNSFDTTGIGEVSFNKFLKSEKFKDRIQHLHALSGLEKGEYKRKHLPCITPSCTCSPRSETGVIQHSGFIQFDIDAQENTKITDWPAERDVIAQIPEVAYCALSSSGLGVWGLVRIKYPDKHREHFTALEQGFRKNDYVIDQSCKNVTRLRYYTWDPDAIFKYEAPVLSRFIDRPRPRVKYVKQKGACGDRQRVEAAIEQIIQHKIDITAGTENSKSYDDWWQIGSAFISAFDQVTALNYFHVVSQFHPDYNIEETQEQFDRLLYYMYDFDLSIFFSRCKYFGINVMNSAVCIDGETRKRGSLPTAPSPGNSDQGQSHTVQEIANHVGESSSIVIEDDFTQHIRELAQDKNAICSLLDLIHPGDHPATMYDDNGSDLTRFAEKNDNDQPTLD